MSMLSIYGQGFFLQASLIFALGALNIFVLNCGLRRQRHLLVALIQSIIDALLIAVGVLGVATVFVQIPILKIALGIAGVSFLFIYGFLKLKEAMNGIELSFNSKHATTVRQTILESLAFSLLNPHVYLDLVVLIGGYSSRYSQLKERFYFGAGAASFSTIWFFGLVLLASWGSRLLNNPKAMRVISLVSGVILIVLAIRLGSDVITWIRA